MIAETSCIRMHQDMCLRHIAEFILIDITQPHVVIADAFLHVTFTLDGDIIFVANVIHQVVIIAAAEVRSYHVKPQRVDFPDKVIVAIEHIDVFQTVSVRSHLPERGFLHLVQILRREKFRILLRELLRIGHHRRLEVQILHDLLREYRRIPPPVLEHQIEGARRQRFLLTIVVEDILLRDRDIALIVQLCELSAQLLLADERARIADTIDAKIGERDKAAILGTDIIV